MELTVAIPDDLAERLGADGEDIARRALEAFAVEAYRAERLTLPELRRLLGFGTRAALDAFLARIPMGRAAQPEDIADPALFLASEEARYVSGASLLVDGAWAVTGYPDMRPFRGRPGWPRG